MRIVVATEGIRMKHIRETIVIELIVGEIIVIGVVIEVEIGVVVRTVEDHRKNPVKVVRAKALFEAGKARVI